MNQKKKHAYETARKRINRFYQKDINPVKKPDVLDGIMDKQSQTIIKETASPDVFDKLRTLGTVVNAAGAPVAFDTKTDVAEMLTPENQEAQRRLIEKYMNQAEYGMGIVYPTPYRIGTHTVTALPEVVEAFELDTPEKYDLALSTETALLGYMYQYMRKFNGWRYATASIIKQISLSPLGRSLVVERIMSNYRSHNIQKAVSQVTAAEANKPKEERMDNEAVGRELRRLLTEMFIREYIDDDFKLEMDLMDTDFVVQRKPNKCAAILMVHTQQPVMSQEGERIFDWVEKTRIIDVVNIKQIEKFTPFMIDRAGNFSAPIFSKSEPIITVTKDEPEAPMSVVQPLIDYKN